MSGQGERGNAASASGNVHPRDGSDDSSSPVRQRQRITDAAAVDDHRYEHAQVLSYAARGRNKRFYIPSTENYFGGIRVNNIMFDSGCSTLLLPYPLETSFPPELLNNSLYSWVVGTSRGTGAVHSLVLSVSSRIGRKFPVTLAGKAQGESRGVPKLRFQLGSGAVNQVLESPQLLALLDQGCIDMLNGFLTRIGDRTIEERNYALLGQSYLANVSQFQTGNVTLAISPDFPENENLWEIAGRYQIMLGSMVREFENWSDLEDHDTDVDDEDYRTSWDQGAKSDDEIDELVDR